MPHPSRTRSAETWSRAREAYLAGEPAESVCARFDIALRTLRDRARLEGWRRADQPDPEPIDPPGEASPDADIDDEELRRIARARMAHAARRGLVGEALRWARFTEIIARQGQTDHVRARQRDDAVAEREQTRRSVSLMRDVTASARSIEAQAKAILATDRARGDLHAPHDPHPVSDRANAPTAEDAALTRADRRRLAKQGRKRR